MQTALTPGSAVTHSASLMFGKRAPSSIGCDTCRLLTGLKTSLYALATRAYGWVFMWRM